VNPTLVLSLLRQRLSSPFRLIALLVLAGPPLFLVLLAPQAGFAPLGDVYFLALAFAAGLIGQDLSSGTLPLLLTRPVTRTRYVTSRWLAASAGTVAVALLQHGLAALLMVLRGAPPPATVLLLALGNAVLLALGTCAVMTLFSSLLSGLGDLGLMALLQLSSNVLAAVGAARSSEALVRAAQEAQRFLKPGFDLATLGHGGALPVFELVSYLSTVTLGLALAIVIMNRRELSYATS
jgi:ABC-type transport system involved in multi-copper enzyme maturation permease subunit